MSRAVHAIQICSLSKSFGRVPVLRAIDLDLRPGALSVLIGRSGSGKSTLLRCLNGLETPEQGQITAAGVTRRFPEHAFDKDLEHSVRLKVGMVFQQFHLFGHLNVFENLTLAPRVGQARATADTTRAATALLKKLGLHAHGGHYPHQLSGGQQQRAAIARALLLSPEVLLLDEPTSALDPHLAQEVLEVMLRLKREGMTQVLVTHELEFARRYADHVVFLEEGQVIEQGSPARIFGKPRDPRTRTFTRGQR